MDLHLDKWAKSYGIQKLGLLETIYIIGNHQ
jgi:hypothetical protein